MGLMNGEAYRKSLDDGRQVWIEGERVPLVTAHPAFVPMIDAIAQIYDLHHNPAHRDLFTFRTGTGEVASRFYKLPTEPNDIALRREMTAQILREVSPVIDRFGDETVSPLFVLYENKDLLDRYDSRYHHTVLHWLKKLCREHLFMSSGNTDMKGDRSKQPFQQRDPDVHLRVVEERDDGIIINGAKFETGASYAHVAFVKPTVGVWNAENRDFAVACIVPMNAPGLRHICRAPLPRKNDFEAPLSSKYDEIDTLIIFDHVLVPWENVLFSRQPELASLIRTGLSTWGGHDFLVRSSAKADLAVGAALLLAEQTRAAQIPAVREKISALMMYAQGIKAFILASEAAAENTPGGLYRPNQAIQNAGRLFSSTEFNKVIQILRELGGGVQVIAPDLKSLNSAETRAYVAKYFAIEDVDAEARARALHLISELTSSAFAGRMQLYQMFAEGPTSVQATLVYNTYDRKQAIAFASDIAGIEPTAGRAVRSAA